MLKTIVRRILAMVFLSILTTSTRGQTIDSLLAISWEEYDTSLSISCYELGKKVFAASMDSSLLLFEKGGRIAEKLKFSRGKILNWRSMGAVMGRLGKYDEAIDILQRGLALVEAEELPIINRVDFLINIGAAHHFAGFTGKAIETYIEAVDLAREHGFDDKRSMLLNNLGIFYRTLNRHEEAIQIYEESIAIRRASSDTAGVAGVYHNMGSAFYIMKQYEKALNTYYESQKLYTQLGASKDLLINQIAVGEVLTAMGKYDDVIASYEAIVQKNGIQGIDHTTKYTLFSNLAKSYIGKWNYQKALASLNQIEPILTLSDLAPQRIDFAEMKANILAALDRHSEANVYLNQYIQLSKEQAEAQSKQLLKEMETKYLSLEKDHKITLLNSSNEIQILQLEKKNRQLIYSGIGLLTAFLAVYGFYLAYRTKNKANESLHLKNNQLQDALQNNKMLIKEIHHRVKNNLQVISALLTLQSSHLKDVRAKEALKEGQDRVQSMALIHKDLYQHDNLKGVNTKDYLEQLIGNLFQSYRIDEGDIKLKMQIEPIILDVDTMIPMGLMINELISNALKHAFNNNLNNLLSISLREKSDILHLTIKDNGSGVEDIELMKEQSFGYSLIQSFARKLDAQLNITNDDGLRIELLIRNYHKV